MNKILFKILAIILAVVIVVIIAVPSVISVRGSIKKYSVPEELNVSLNNSDTEKSSADSVRIMSSNLLVHYKSWGGSDAHMRAKMFFDVLEFYKPDVIGLQEVSDQWFCCLVKNSGSYKMLYPVSTGALVRMTGIMYNSDTLSVIKKGQQKYSVGDNPRLRRVVWALFENKETHKRFIVTSTHLDLIRKDKEEAELNTMNTQADELIALTDSLSEKYGVPVFCTGDYNAMDFGGLDSVMDAPSIYEKLASKLTDTKTVAEMTTEGDSWKISEPTYDHIFLNGNAQVLRYSILSDNVMDEMSDHYPIFIDAEI